MVAQQKLTQHFSVTVKDNGDYRLIHTPTGLAMGVSYPHKTTAKRTAIKLESVVGIDWDNGKLCVINAGKREAKKVANIIRESVGLWKV